MNLKELTEAKATRDTVRKLIVEAVRDLPAVPSELQALLQADQDATDALARVWYEYAHGHQP